LTPRRIVVVAQKHFHRFFRGEALFQKLQATPAERGVGKRLRGDRTDAGFGPRHDIADGEESRRHRHTQFAGDGIPAGDRKGGNGLRRSLLWLFRLAPSWNCRSKENNIQHDHRYTVLQKIELKHGCLLIFLSK
jgi:hypothetical protein